MLSYFHFQKQRVLWSTARVPLLSPSNTKPSKPKANDNTPYKPVIKHSRAKQEEGSRDSALVHQCIHINARMWTLPVNILISNEQLVKVIYTVRFISHHCTSQVNQWYASARNWTLLLLLSRVRRKANVSNNNHQGNWTLRRDNSREIR